jgi:hypothetical protein
MFQLLLYYTGEGNEAGRARQPKLIDFGVGSDGEARTLARRLKANFPNILTREELVHLCQGFLNRSVRRIVFNQLLHGTKAILIRFPFPLPRHVTIRAFFFPGAHLPPGMYAGHPFALITDKPPAVAKALKSYPALPTADAVVVAYPFGMFTEIHG